MCFVLIPYVVTRYAAMNSDV